MAFGRSKTRRFLDLKKNLHGIQSPFRGDWLSATATCCQSSGLVVLDNHQQINTLRLQSQAQPKFCDLEKYRSQTMTTNMNTHTARGLLLHTNGHALPVHIAQNDDEDIRRHLGCDIFTTQSVRPESKGGQAGLTVFVDLEAELDRGCPVTSGRCGSGPTSGSEPLTGKILLLGPLDDEGYCLIFPTLYARQAPASLRQRPHYGLEDQIGVSPHQQNHRSPNVMWEFIPRLNTSRKSRVTHGILF